MKNISSRGKILIGLTIIVIVSGAFFIFTESGNKIALKIFNKKKVVVQVDGKVIEHITESDTLEDILEEVDITIDADDKISKSINKKVDIIEEIVINRIEIKEEEISKEIPFEKKEVIDYKTRLGETKVLSKGDNGIKNIKYEVTYEDGVEVDRIIEEEKIIEEPIAEVIATGIFEQSSLTVLVNQNRKVSANYVPEDLVVPDLRSFKADDGVMLRKEAAESLEKLFEAADKNGVYLYMVSGYRSYDYQASIYNPYSGYSAPPGASEHQLGLAMDVTIKKYNGRLETSFGDTKEGKWVKENAHKYGFHIRYLEGKEDITGYYYEPWHLRYLGVELATELHESGLTMEEHFGEY